MQLGNFRFTTPEDGLNVALGQLPLDLFLLSTSLKTHIRIRTQQIKRWNGKGPGKLGRIGHRLRMEMLTEKLGIPEFCPDSLPKESGWDKQYIISEDDSGHDEENILRLYTDGSKMDGNSGYGAVLLDNDDEHCGELSGSKGPLATVFQAECHAIIEGVELLSSHPDKTSDLTILTDNQSVVKALASHTTETKTVKQLKQTLNSIGNTRKITIKWIKAHVGYMGNEKADELAKLGSTTLPIGPAPHAPLAKPEINNTITSYVYQIWADRWDEKKDSRQTRIFFPEINLSKSRELTKLSKDNLGKVIRAITGHDFRKRHTSILEKTNDNICRFCQTDTETPSHIILHCPTLTHQRAQAFKSYTADIRQIWAAKELAAFLSAPTIAEMETSATT